MNRRAVLASGGLALSAGLAGCLSVTQGETLSTEFEKTDDVDVRFDESPEVSDSNGSITVEGTIQYGSSRCNTAELAHAEYESRPARLDLLVIATEDPDAGSECTDDLSSTGYRIHATVNDTLHYVAVTEHHVHDYAYSTTVDLR